MRRDRRRQRRCRAARARRLPLLLSCLLSCLAARVAGAQTSLGTVEVEAERAEGDSAKSPEPVPFVTVIDARAPSARAASVADLLERQAGVQLRSRGGLGAFTSVSLRGSEQNEVAIYIDGVPLSRAASGTIDLGQIPVDGLERVEIYRGVPPVEFGAEAVGGVIHLVTRKGTRRPSWRASAGVGSFGARSATAGYSGGGGGLRASVSASYHGAKGDFRYYDYAGTQFLLADDRVGRRRNNDFDQAALDATVSGRAGKLRYRLGGHGFLKLQGVPGLGSAGSETEHARLTTGRALLDGELALGGRHVDVRVGGHLLVERVAFVNEGGELVGAYGPSSVEGEGLGGGISARADAPIGRHQILSVIGEGRFERRAPYDLLHPRRAGLPSWRVLGGVSIVDDLRLMGDRLAITPAVRLDGVTSDLTIPGGSSSENAETRASDYFLSPRLSVRARVHDAVTLRAAAGRFVRFPTLLEQFGDGAFVLGRNRLRPEVAWAGELGASLAAERSGFGFSLEAVGFARHIADAIVFVPVANAVAAVNVGRSRTLGAEARLAGHVGGWLRAALDYTLLDAVDLGAAERTPDIDSPRPPQLPGRPRHQLAARVDIGGGPLRLYYEISYTSQQYRDTNNNNIVPARTLHALGAVAAHGPFSITVDIRNLLDLRVVDLPLGGTARRGETTPYPLVDFFDYPLPGRAVYVTAAYRR